jgi:heterodisulfide reductase subunit C
VLPADGEAFTREEAVAESQRCLKCSCDACQRFCDLMQYFKKMPKRIAEEVQLTIQPGTLDGNGTIATRFISTCNYCGLCKEVCPKAIDTGELLLTSHRQMREKGAMPWAFHEFFLRDLAFANGEAALTKLPVGHDQSRYVLFPAASWVGRTRATSPRPTACFPEVAGHRIDARLLWRARGVGRRREAAPANTTKLREDWADARQAHRDPGVPLLQGRLQEAPARDPHRLPL